jgi:hypothetical protein
VEAGVTTVDYTYAWDEAGNPLTVPVIPENVFSLPERKGADVMQLVAFPDTLPPFDPSSERGAPRNLDGLRRRFVFLTSTLKDNP